MLILYDPVMIAIANGFPVVELLCFLVKPKISSHFYFKYLLTSLPPTPLPPHLPPSHPVPIHCSLASLGHCLLCTSTVFYNFWSPKSLDIFLILFTHIKKQE